MSPINSHLTIGPVYLRLMHDVGVDSLDTLSQQDPIELHSRLFAQSLETRCIPPTLDRVQFWIRAARKARTNTAIEEAV